MRLDDEPVIVSGSFATGSVRARLGSVPVLIFSLRT